MRGVSSANRLGFIDVLLFILIVDKLGQLLYDLDINKKDVDMKTLKILALGLLLMISACNSTPGPTASSGAIQAASITAPVSQPVVTPIPSPTPSAIPTFVQPVFSVLLMNLQLENGWVTSTFNDPHVNGIDANIIVISDTGLIYNIYNASLSGSNFYNLDVLSGSTFQITELTVDGSSITYASGNPSAYLKAEGTITLSGNTSGNCDINSVIQPIISSDFNILPGTYYYTMDQTQNPYGQQALKLIDPQSGGTGNFYPLQGGSLKLYSDSARQNLIYNLGGNIAASL